MKEVYMYTSVIRVNILHTQNMCARDHVIIIPEKPNRILNCVLLVIRQVISSYLHDVRIEMVLDLRKCNKRLTSKHWM